MDNSAQLLGQVLFLLLFGLLPVFFLRDGFRAKTSSLRYANFALACGLAFFILPEMVLRPIPPGWVKFSGILRLCMGIAGTSFAILSLVRRSKDQGTSVVRPLLGLGFSACHALVGIGFAFFHLLSPVQVDPATAWTYKDAEFGFEVKLPSNAWRQGKSPQGDVSFAHLMPRMLCNVFTVQKTRNETDFDAFVKKQEDFLMSSPIRRSTMKKREGTSSQGAPFVYWQCMDESSQGGQVFVASSVTFCKQKGVFVQLLFEGQSGMLSQMGKETDLKSFHTAADYILLSVE